MPEESLETRPRIKLLANWEQLGEAYLGLMRKTLDVPTWAVKQWDLWHFHEDLLKLDPQAFILDIGCGGNSVLRLAWKMGFHRILGVDLRLSMGDRVRFAEDVVRNLMSRTPGALFPYRMVTRDYREIRGDQLYGAITALSVIEHGLEAEQFFAAARRLIKSHGILCLSTDYWPTPISTVHIDSKSTFGLEWHILDAVALDGWIRCAMDHDFIVPPDDEIRRALSSVPTATSHWHGLEFSAIYLCLVRR